MNESLPRLYPDLNLLIGGEWRHRDEGETVVNPANEAPLGHLPHATRADLEDAVQAAVRGFEVWRRTPPLERASVLIRAARLMRERSDEIGAAVTLEQGKPLAQSRAEVLRASEMLEWDANEGLRLYGRVIPSGPGLQRLVTREPLGVVAAFTPWNFPISSPLRKIGGALSAGCSLILKASEETPAGTILIARALMDAGLPNGVLNLVFGDPAAISNFLIPHPVVRMIAFTGSVPIGKHLAALAGRHMKPALMELGGHGPVIICDDVDPVSVAAQSVAIKSRNSGQICVSPTRFFVEEGVYDAFLDAFIKKAEALRLGDGMADGVDMGPLANIRRLAAVEDLVADAAAKGAKVRTGGRRVGNQGFFYPLTVITDASDDVRATHEEPFGPIALVAPVASVAEAITRANALPFGLAGYGFAQASSKIDAISSGLECGTISINYFSASTAETPFGGVKDSGYGREGGIEGIEAYSFVKMVSRKVE